MRRTPFAIYRQVRLAISWYGKEYSFTRKQLNKYKEPMAEEDSIQTISGMYHASERSFIELINSEGASVKSKVSKGILCDADTKLSIQQGDKVIIDNKEFYVTAVEPVLYNDKAVAQEISVEELIEGNGAV